MSRSASRRRVSQVQRRRQEGSSTSNVAGQQNDDRRRVLRYDRRRCRRHDQQHQSRRQHRRRDRAASTAPRSSRFLPNGFGLALLPQVPEVAHRHDAVGETMPSTMTNPARPIDGTPRQEHAGHAADQRDGRLARGRRRPSASRSRRAAPARCRSDKATRRRSGYLARGVSPAPRRGCRSNRNSRSRRAIFGHAKYALTFQHVDPRDTFLALDNDAAGPMKHPLQHGRAPARQRRLNPQFIDRHHVKPRAPTTPRHRRSSHHRRPHRHNLHQHRRRAPDRHRRQPEPQHRLPAEAHLRLGTSACGSTWRSAAPATPPTASRACRRRPRRSRSDRLPARRWPRSAREHLLNPLLQVGQDIAVEPRVAVHHMLDTCPASAWARR